jgi:hypothetical protein
VSAEPLARLDTRARDARDESSGAEPGKVFGGVVRLVGADRDRSPSSWPAPGAYGGKAQEQRLERLAVMHVRTGHCDGQRDALRFGQHMQLAALLTAIDRVRPGQRAPLFARTDAASMIAEVQSSAPLAPSSSRTARCSREPAMRGGRRGAERRRQIPSGTTTGQHVHHRREHLPIRHRYRPATLRSGPERWYQWRGNLPQPIADQVPRKIHSHSGRSCPTWGRWPVLGAVRE